MLIKFQNGVDRVKHYPKSFVFCDNQRPQQLMQHTKGKTHKTATNESFNGKQVSLGKTSTGREDQAILPVILLRIETSFCISMIAVKDKEAASLIKHTFS